MLIIPEAIAEGETGLLFESGNADALVETILQLLANPSVGESLVNIKSF